MNEDSNHPIDNQPTRYGDRLVLIWGENGQPHIYTHDTMPVVRSYTASGGRSYRQQIESLFETQARYSTFWMSYYKEYLQGETNGKIPLVVGSEAYTVHIGTHHTGFRGYDGRHFKFKLIDSKQLIESNNVWSRGTVPPHFREFIAPNAILLPQVVLGVENDS